jgi:1-deoxyxylulose-5-phosphate synthase
MNRLNRRDFLMHSAGATAAALTVPAVAQQAPAKLSAGTVRTIGKTGLKCSLLGQGTGMRGWKGSSDMTRLGRKEFIKLLEHGHGKGITFYDLADMYGSHSYLHDAMKRSIKREDIMILTKAISRAPGLMRADLERFRKEIGTDYLDIVLMHCLTNANWTDDYKATMDVMLEAKEKGHIRAVGVSCHKLDALKAAAESDWVDVILARINPFAIKMDGTVDEVVPVLKKAHAAGKGILGMKIVGEGQLSKESDKIQESVNYVLGLGCVDAITVGFTSQAQVDDMVARIGQVPA